MPKLGHSTNTSVQKYKLWLLLFIGTICWSATMVKSGLIYDYGMGFWGANGHDGIWHISLIKSLSQGSMQMPIFAGEGIKNYHIGFDLLVAALHTVSRIPVVTLYFQILPPLFAFAIGLLTYLLTKNIWSVFFVYFGGSWAWLFGRGESTFWSQQAISTLINPPLALSLILLLVGLILIRSNKELLATLFFVIAGFVKVYAGLLALAALLVVGLIKDRKFIKIFIFTLIFSAAMYLPLNRNSTSLLVWQPGWFLETMMGLSDRLNWPRFYSAMTNYRLADNWPKAVLAYTVAFLIFWFGNMGTRGIKEISVLKDLKNIRNISSEHLFIWTIIIAGGIVPMFFLQKGTPWNTIQFFYYSLFFSSVLAGLSVEYLLSKIKNSKFIILASVLIVVLTIPTTIISLKDIYLPGRPPAMISTRELEALNFLATLPKGTVLTPPVVVNPYAKAPRPLYLYESTAYVSAISGQPVFMEDEVNLNITDYAWETRKSDVKSLFEQTDKEKAKKFVNDNNISYVYLPRIHETRPYLSDTQMGMKNIFENSEAAIWQRQ